MKNKLLKLGFECVLKMAFNGKLMHLWDINKSNYEIEVHDNEKEAGWMVLNVKKKTCHERPLDVIKFIEKELNKKPPYIGIPYIKKI